MGYIGNLSIEDVLKSVLMATLKASTNRSLRDAYHKVLDDLDDDNDLSFAGLGWTQSSWISSKTIASASFDATLTSATLLHRVATSPELHGVTKAPTARFVRRSTKRAPSLVMVCLPFFATFSTIMVSSD
jgi:hypothetical protein